MQKAWLRSGVTPGVPRGDGSSPSPRLGVIVASKPPKGGISPRWPTWSGKVVAPPPFLGLPPRALCVLLCRPIHCPGAFSDWPEELASPSRSGRRCAGQGRLGFQKCVFPSFCFMCFLFSVVFCCFSFSALLSRASPALCVLVFLLFSYWPANAGRQTRPRRQVNWRMAGCVLSGCESSGALPEPLACFACWHGPLRHSPNSCSARNVSPRRNRRAQKLSNNCPIVAPGAAIRPNFDELRSIWAIFLPNSANI